MGYVLLPAIRIQTLRWVGGDADPFGRKMTWQETRTAGGVKAARHSEAWTWTARPSTTRL